VLPANQALLLQAREGFRDEIGNGHDNSARVRVPGEQWLFYGPGEYWPPLQVKVLLTITASIESEALKLYVFRPGIALFWLALVVVVLVALGYFAFGSSSGAARIDL